MAGGSAAEKQGIRKSQRLRMEAMPERSLIAAVVRGDEHAADVFCQRFYGSLLASSGRYGIRGGDAEHLVLEILHDFIMAIVDGRLTAPAAALPHLLYALRRRAFTLRRSRVREGNSLEMAVTDGGEAVASGSCSQSSLRQSRASRDDDEPLDPTLARLMNALAESLAADERLLLEWVGHRVPQRLIAKWLGEEYETVGRRIRRLIRRLVDSSIVLSGALDEPDRLALQRFFARSGINHDRSIRNERRQ
jgi:hypothetical protein